MGVSFYDEPSLVEAVSSLRFADNPNSFPGTGSIAQDGSGLDDPSSILESVNISQERRDDGIGGG